MTVEMVGLSVACGLVLRHHVLQGVSASYLMRLCRAEHVKFPRGFWSELRRQEDRSR